MERTLVLVKPDGVQRRQVGEIISRLEKRGLQLLGMKLLQPSSSLAEKHYESLQDRPFYPSLIAFLTSGPVVAMVWGGPGAVEAVRQSLGATDPLKAAPGTIRGDLGLHIQMNLAHGSDSPQTAEREVALWFSPGELVSWKAADEEWVAGR
ncbi:MAG: nucleoside-diphosphate kinase [Bacillota bacterium]|nr:nucleoside-diphosphate kinase [Bacillota bacterium]